MDIPRELPSMLMCFGQYKIWSRFLTQFKMPTNRTKFKADLEAAEKQFHSKYGQNSKTQKSVFFS